MPPGEAVTLDFSNVDIRDVVRSVLGDVLKLNYVLDPAVQGTVTLQTPTPLPRTAVLAALDNALRLSGAAMVEKSGIIDVVPLANAGREVRLNAGAVGGFVARVVSPRYVAATDLQRLLEPMVPTGSTLRADPGRNALIVTGPSQEVGVILNNIATFDVDYLKGMSFALLPLRTAQAKDVARELATLIGSGAGVLGGMVKVTPINRLNAVLVTAMQPEYIDRVTAWVHRLDQGNAAATQNRQLFVYRIQNGRAGSLAGSLRKALGTGDAADTSGRNANSGDGGQDNNDTPASQAGQAGTTPSPNPLVGGISNAQLAQLRGAIDSTTGRGATDAAAAGPQINADEANNALLVMATPQEYSWIEATLRQLDIPQLQVMIEAVVAEVTLTNDLTYGLQYYIQSGQFQALLAQPNGPASQNNQSQGGSAFPGFNLVSGFNLGFTSTSGSRIILQMLQQISNVTVLSSPNLMVLNNHSARIQVGDQVPITTQSAVSVLTANAPMVNSVQYRDTGIILQIKPMVNASGNVLLEVSEEVSQVQPTTSSTLNTPTISQRRMTSTITVHDGQTVALGGLLGTSHNTSTNGIPFLQNLPLIGPLFGAKTNNATRTELIALITPRVVYDQRGAQAVTDELKQKLPLTIPVTKRPR